VSRSRRKTPVIGVTTSDSEKQDKTEYNRRHRRVVKQAVHIDDETRPLPGLHEHSNPWSMSKDGKMRFDPDKNRDLMRK
jgi:hypothetical protein